MGVRNLLLALAAQAEMPVFVVVGAGGRRLTDELPLAPGVRVVDSPRAANVLLLVGRATPALLPGLLALHDQLAEPRSAVWWPVGSPSADDLVPEQLAAVLPDMVTSRPGDLDGLRAVHRALLDGSRTSARPALRDVPPTPWRGVGPYGTGGEGMMGGAPYGRPMAMTAPDPDGLELDQLHLRVGPMLAPLPPGLVLDLEVQGDVLRVAGVGENPYRAEPPAAHHGSLDTAPFLAAATERTAVAQLEVARAAHHLRAVSRTLRLAGLDARSRRTLRLARSVTTGDRTVVAALARTVRRSRSLRSALAGVGTVSAERAAVLGGPVARASGVQTDARVDDPGYAGLDVDMITQDAGDAWSRLLQRLDEIVLALDLAERAGDRLRRPGPDLEGPRGLVRPGSALPSAALLGLLPALLAGQEWGDAMTTVVSLDIDVEEAATALRPVGGPVPSGSGA